MRYRCACGKEFNGAIFYYRHIRTCKIYQKRKKKIDKVFIDYLLKKLKDKMLNLKLLKECKGGSNG